METSTSSMQEMVQQIIELKENMLPSSPKEVSADKESIVSNSLPTKSAKIYAFLVSKSLVDLALKAFIDNQTDHGIADRDNGSIELYGLNGAKHDSRYTNAVLRAAEG